MIFQINILFTIIIVITTKLNCIWNQFYLSKRNSCDEYNNYVMGNGNTINMFKNNCNSYGKSSSGGINFIVKSYETLEKSNTILKYDPKVKRTSNLLQHLLSYYSSKLNKSIEFQEIILNLNSTKQHFFHRLSVTKELNSLTTIKKSLKRYCKTRFVSLYEMFNSFLMKMDCFDKFNEKIISRKNWVKIFIYREIINVINETSLIFSKTNEITRDKNIYVLYNTKNKIEKLEEEFSKLNEEEIIMKIQREIEEKKNIGFEEKDDVIQNENNEKCHFESFVNFGFEHYFREILIDSLQMKIDPYMNGMENKSEVFYLERTENSL